MCVVGGEHLQVNTQEHTITSGVMWAVVLHRLSNSLIQKCFTLYYTYFCHSTGSLPLCKHANPFSSVGSLTLCIHANTFSSVGWLTLYIHANTFSSVGSLTLCMPAPLALLTEWLYFAASNRQKLLSDRVVIKDRLSTQSWYRMFNKNNNNKQTNKKSDKEVWNWKLDLNHEYDM